MKIEFTNKKLTCAVITRSRWSWRRFGFIVEWAEVEYHSGDMVWFYTANGLVVEGAFPEMYGHGLHAKICHAVDRERACRNADALVKHATEHPPAWKVWEPSMGRVSGVRL